MFLFGQDSIFVAAIHHEGGLASLIEDEMPEPPDELFLKYGLWNYKYG